MKDIFGNAIGCILIIVGMVVFTFLFMVFKELIGVGGNSPGFGGSPLIFIAFVALISIIAGVIKRLKKDDNFDDIEK